MLTKTSLKEIAAQFTEVLWDNNNMDIADEIFHTDFKDYDHVQGQGPGVAGYKQMLCSFKLAFPDLRIKNEDVIEDE